LASSKARWFRILGRFFEEHKTVAKPVAFDCKSSRKGRGNADVYTSYRHFTAMGLSELIRSSFYRAFTNQ
jgi:hypothetical protein